jgi:homoserine kinase type II
MANYTYISPEQVQSILKLYGLPQLLSMLPMSSGISNSNYRIDLQNNKSVLLKISNDKNFHQLEEEQSILHKLKEIDHPLSLAPLQTLDGRFVYQFENFHGVIFPFVHGEIKKPNLQVCFQIGEALAKLHLYGKKIDLDTIRHHGQVGFDHNHLEAKSEVIQYITGLYEECCDLLPNVSSAFFQLLNQKTGLIHGDLYYDNVLFQNDKVLTLLDFEQAGVGPLLLDIGISISGTCLNQQKELDRQLIQSYLQGYQNVAPLNDDELKYIDDSIILGLISIALWRVKRFNMHGIDQQKKDNYKELIARAQYFKKNKGEL